MDNVLLINKPTFLTPLEAIDEFRKIQPEYQHARLGYAGRLDPLAEGLLIILVNDENKRRKEYEKLDKEYTFKAMVGISTDSYDYMGIFTRAPQPSPKNPEDDIQKMLPQFLGKQMQPYPIYSSARVNGKPLYYWARNNIDVTIPTKEIEIYELTYTHINMISLSSFAKFAAEGVSKVNGSFRQKEIIEQWKEYFDDNKRYYSAEFHLRCSSGTYVRGIVDQIGRQLQTGAVAYDIKRIKIGDYSLKSSILLSSPASKDYL